MSPLDWLIAVYGLACIIAIGRGLQAAINQNRIWRAAFWCASAFCMGLYIEIMTPLTADFSTIMLRFIQVAGMVL